MTLNYFIELLMKKNGIIGLKILIYGLIILYMNFYEQ